MLEADQKTMSHLRWTILGINTLLVRLAIVLSAMSSNLDQYLDNRTSKWSFEFSKSMKRHSQNVEAQLPFLKVFDSRTPTFLPYLLWLCLSQFLSQCFFLEFWKLKLGKALKLSPN